MARQGVVLSSPAIVRDSVQERAFLVPVRADPKELFRQRMTAEENEALIKRFYSCFQARDAEGMAACYHADVEFNDPAFVGLKGFRAGAMWKMLIERGKGDLRLEVSNIKADEAKGSAHWEAYYTFSQTNRPVHNIIDAEFEFKDGKIVRHTDTFDFWRWAGQALGLSGRLLGWTSFMQNAVRSKAAAGLDAYIAKRGLDPNAPAVAPAAAEGAVASSQ